MADKDEVAADEANQLLVSADLPPTIFSQQGLRGQEIELLYRKQHPTVFINNATEKDDSQLEDDEVSQLSADVSGSDDNQDAESIEIYSQYEKKQKQLFGE